MTQAYNLAILANAVDTSGRLNVGTNATGTLPVANGGTGQSSASAAFNSLSPITTTGDLIIGNGTNSATRLPIGANNTVLKSNGTTASWGTLTTGTVTSVATGNGLSGGPITTSGTISIAAPTAGSVGSYILGGNYGGGGIGSPTFTFDFNGSYAAGISTNQVATVVITDLGYTFTNNLSGTWRWLSNNASTSGGGVTQIIGLMVRIA